MLAPLGRDPASLWRICEEFFGMENPESNGEAFSELLQGALQARTFSNVSSYDRIALASSEEQTYLLPSAALNTVRCVPAGKNLQP